MSITPEGAPSSAQVSSLSLLRLPVGAASPLWGLFAGAAVSGAAWWWMTRWTRPVNLEAMFGAPAPVAPQAGPELLALEPAAPLAAVVDAAEPVIEAIVDTVVAVVEAPLVAVEAILEAPEDPFEVVGGESAPVSPLLEALLPEPSPPVVEAEAAPETLIAEAATVEPLPAAESPLPAMEAVTAVAVAAVEAPLEALAEPASAAATEPAISSTLAPKAPRKSKSKPA